MKKITFVFGVYTLVLGLLVGAIAAIFLGLVHFSTDFLWTYLPEQLQSPWYYPLIMGLIGGLFVGILQLKFGGYPHSMHENMAELKRTGRIEYKNRLLKTIVTAWIILSFGASVGPEAALIGIVGSSTTWIIDHLKVSASRKEELISLSIGAIISSIFLSPFSGLAEEIDDSTQAKKVPKNSKLVLSILISFSALASFLWLKSFMKMPASIFAIRLPDAGWSWWFAILFIPMIILGWLFSIYFEQLQVYIAKALSFIKNKMLLALVGGFSIGIFGIISYYLLFSGEHQLIEITKNVQAFSILTLLTIALLKPVLVGICLATGWKGGAIFPAIFSSSVMGYLVTVWLDGPTGFLITIFVAASCTKIIGKPALTASILLFVFPLQFFPFILLTAFIVNKNWWASFKKLTQQN
ncbi:chloride channel protein [Listeria ivanovii]|uniref:Chloride channel protein n=2 Tax=Listeria ivanovii TaxID=1638 RepID=A0ABS1G830_LISIV|nr:chloride channel protein [Listeria ivanovii]EFR95968.1 chloride channel protein [Listeria ivanovii FSL F6-596]AIS60707.1 chloride channel protein [Listeria ivanovii subsp. londoniensis]AIS63533.1 chloride channel protein [Listeria ivanovii subsp. londoniensis]MBK1962741.1 chloride channel protein [Listeria ivanovii subsp. londoniensis]MBK1967692.1 chloride channel protein [Listeria ivanovii subsp. londoniensis]